MWPWEVPPETRDREQVPPGEADVVRPTHPAGRRCRAGSRAGGRSATHRLGKAAAPHGTGCPLRRSWSMAPRWRAPGTRGRALLLCGGQECSRLQKRGRIHLWHREEGPTQGTEVFVTHCEEEVGTQHPSVTHKPSSRPQTWPAVDIMAVNSGLGFILVNVFVPTLSKSCFFSF